MLSFAPEQGSYPTCVYIPGKHVRENQMLTILHTHIKRTEADKDLAHFILVCTAHLPGDFLSRVRDVIKKLQALLPGLHLIGSPEPAEAAAPEEAPSDNPASLALESTSAPAEATHIGSGAATSEPLLHFSLSRTLPVRFHLVATLLQALREALADQSSCSLRVGGLRCFVNDERTRSFLALPVLRQTPEDHKAYRKAREPITALARRGLLCPARP